MVPIPARLKPIPSEVSVNVYNTTYKTGLAKVVADQLKARVVAIAEALLKKDRNALRATKWAVRRMTEMTYENAEDYLIRTQEALHSYGGVEARHEATRQFLDEKSFKPGLGAFDTSKVKG